MTSSAYIVLTRMWSKDSHRKEQEGHTHTPAVPSPRPTLPIILRVWTLGKLLLIAQHTHSLSLFRFSKDEGCDTPPPPPIIALVNCSQHFGLSTTFVCRFETIFRFDFTKEIQKAHHPNGPPKKIPSFQTHIYFLRPCADLRLLCLYKYTKLWAMFVLFMLYGN